MTELEQLQADVDRDLQRITTDSDEPSNQAPDQSKEIETLKTQLAELRGALEQTNRQRQYVGPDGDRPTPPARQPEPQQTQFTRREYKPDEWAETAVRNPSEATMESINAYLGLPKGANPFGLFNVVGKNLEDMRAELKATKDSLAQEKMEREAEKFLTSTPDYVPTQENFQILENYRAHYNLQADARGYDLAFTKAVQDGQLKTKQRSRQAPEDNDDFQPPQRVTAPPRVPSVRQSATVGEEDMSDLFSKLDRLPTSEVGKYLERLSQGR